MVVVMVMDDDMDDGDEYEYEHQQRHLHSESQAHTVHCDGIAYGVAILGTGLHTRWLPYLTLGIRSCILRPAYSERASERFRCSDCAFFAMIPSEFYLFLCNQERQVTKSVKLSKQASKQEVSSKKASKQRIKEYRNQCAFFACFVDRRDKVDIQTTHPPTYLSYLTYLLDLSHTTPPR